MAAIAYLKREGDGTVYPIQRGYKRRRVAEGESGQVEMQL